MSDTPGMPTGFTHTLCLWCGQFEVPLAHPDWRRLATAHAHTCPEHPAFALIQ